MIYIPQSCGVYIFMQPLTHDTPLVINNRVFLDNDCCCSNKYIFQLLLYVCNQSRCYAINGQSCQRSTPYSHLVITTERMILMQTPLKTNVPVQLTMLFNVLQDTEIFDFVVSCEVIITRILAFVICFLEIFSNEFL